MKSAWYSRINQRSGIRSNNEVGAVIQHRSMTVGTDMKRLSVSEHGEIRGTCKVRWKSFSSNSEVRRKLRSLRVHSLNQNRLLWLAYVLHSSTERLSRYRLYSEVGNAWKMI